MVFLKGIVVGFTVGFLVNQMGINGFFLSFVSVLPAKYSADSGVLDHGHLCHCVFDEAHPPAFCEKSLAEAPVHWFGRYALCYSS
jgi:stage II sporulation protein M